MGPKGGPDRDPLGTVVVCTCRRPDLLSGALESLAGQVWEEDRPFGILVVDDGPDEETREVAGRWGARYRATTGEGIARARNLGLREARGEWVAFFDDDQRASSRWLRELVRVFREKGAPIVAGPRRLVPLEGCPPLPSHERLRNYLGGEEWGEVPRPLGGEEIPNTGNVLVGREVFERIGGFDPAFEEGGEDTDFFLRAREAGFQAWCAPGAGADHLVGPEKTAPAWWRKRAFRGGAAEARIRRKMGGRPALLAGLLSRGWLALGGLPLMGAAFLGGRREEALFRLYLFRFFLGYLARTPRFLLGREGAAAGGGPSFRREERERW